MIAAGLAQPSRLSAQAEPMPQTGSPTQLRERAKAAFGQATSDFAAGRYREALLGFEQAARLLPSAELWFNIGRAREELGQLEGAVEAYRHYLRDSVDAPDRAEVEARIRRLSEVRAAQLTASTRARPVALLRIEADPVGAEVTLDEASLGPAPIERWLLLEPGGHALRVERAGHVPSIAQLELDAGTVTVAQARLVAQRTAAIGSRRRVWTWVALTIGSVALASGVGLAIASATADGDSPQSIEVARDATLAAGLSFAMLGALLYGLEGTHEASDVSAR
jgi:tetratricopeptide (TPR) repeat protein